LPNRQKRVSEIQPDRTAGRGRRQLPGKIRSNGRRFFIGYSKLVLSYGPMQRGQDPRLSVAQGVNAAMPVLAQRGSRAHAADNRATSAHAVIVSSFFLIVLAMCLVLGGHAAIDPLLKTAIAARESYAATGDVLYAMPDGIYCRHWSFNNMTGDVLESGIAPCPDDIARDHVRHTRGFAWMR
jgi:hypothetical protein